MSSSNPIKPRRTESVSASNPIKPRRTESVSATGLPTVSASKSSVEPRTRTSSKDATGTSKPTPERAVKPPTRTFSRESLGLLARKKERTSVKHKESAETVQEERKPETNVPAKGQGNGKSNEAVNSKENSKELKSDEEVKPTEDMNDGSTKELEGKDAEEQKGGRDADEMGSKDSIETRVQRMYEKYEELEKRAPEDVLGSVLKSMRESIKAREGSDKDRTSLHELTRSLIGLVIFTMLLVLGILEIVIGIIRVGTCPLRPMIPFWLMVYGMLNVVYNAVGIIFTLVRFKKGRATTIRDCVLGVMTAVWLVWLIMGSFYVYNVYNIVVYEKGHPYYCDRFTYSFTFVFITVTYVVLGIIVCCACYCVVFLCCHNSAVIIIT